MRPRLAGWAFIACLILLLLSAWNTGQNLLYIVLGGVGSFVLMSLALTGWSLRKLRVSRAAPQAVHRGERFWVTVRVENHKRVMPALSLRMVRATAPGDTAPYVLKIPPRRTAVVRMSEVFERRGVHPLPAMLLVSGFPFGLFERRKRIHTSCEVVVYPRVLTVRAALLEQLPGANAIPRVIVGDGDEFFSLREYVRGDDMRRIAWRVSARRGPLIVREMARETARYLVFVIDTGRRLNLEDYEERFEEAIDLAASLAVTLLGQQYTVAIATPGRRLEGGEGKSQIRNVLEMLARVTASDDPRHLGFDWFTPGEELGRASYAFVSPDPADWGRRAPVGGTRILNPREVTRA